MIDYFRGQSLQDIVDSLEARQVDTHIMEARMEIDVDHVVQDTHLTLKVALFNRPAVSAESVKKKLHGDFDDSMELVK